MNNANETHEPPMTVKELADYLRLDRMTLYKMLKEHTIPAARIGHQWRFFRADIDAWIRSHQRTVAGSCIKCGKPLTIKKFTEVADVSKATPDDIEENPYCEPCDIRWIAFHASDANMIEEGEDDAKTEPVGSASGRT